MIPPVVGASGGPVRYLSRNHAVEKQSPPIPALRSEWPQGIRALARVAARRGLVPLKVGSDILTCLPILKER
jgi:hypothetical protein